MEDSTNVSVIIIYSFAFLFVVFLFLQQKDLITPTTGYALFDTNIFNNLGSFSLTTLIILFVVLILLAVGGFFLYKKLKKKKGISLEIPKPPLAEKSISGLDKEFNVPSPNIEENEKQEPSINNDLNELFMETPEENTEKHIEVKPQEVKGEPEFDLQQLKKLVELLMKKKYTKESIIKYLRSKSYTLTQIKQAISSINEENIKNYIKDSLSQGFSKQDIIKTLLNSGWSKEDIIKYI